MHDLTIFAGLQAFWQTVTAAIAAVYQLHDAASEGLDTAVAGGEALDLPGAADLGTPGWPA
ncbi:MAG: hypothetical protein NT169_21315 [Chloroflexi bacterium]|nr:hypothetical protein [Chloroflexota bacterium]